MGDYIIKDTYYDKDELKSGILAATAFAIISTENSLKVYSQGQLLFGRDMILRIKHKVDCKFICQQNQTQSNKDNIRENNKIVEHDYNVGGKVMLNNHDT